MTDQPDEKPDNVVYFDGLTRLNVPVERILRGAMEAGLTECVVLGFTEDGQEYMATSNADGGDVVWLMERCKFRLMEIARDA